MFRLPLIGLAEISWRWSLGLATVAALLFSFREYLATLPVTAGELLLLRTRQPVLILRALARIFQGSAPRAALAAAVLALGLTLAWIIVASAGRAASLRMLFEYFRDSSAPAPLLPFGVVAAGRKNGSPLPSLMALNFLRAATTLAAAVGVLGAFLVAAAASSPAYSASAGGSLSDPSLSDSSPGSALLVFWALTMLAGMAWSLLNWYLSLAAVFVVRDGAPAFEALGSAMDFCRVRAGSLLAAGIWFGIAHAVVFGLAGSVAAFPMGFADQLPGEIVLGGLLLVGLLYFAVVDFLYVGRLAAYVFMAERPDYGPEKSALSLQSPAGGAGAPSDRDILSDDILSDVPGLFPPLGTAEG